MDQLTVLQNNQLQFNQAQQMLTTTKFDASLIENYMHWAQVSETSFKTYLKALNVFFDWLKENNITMPTNDDALRYAEHLKATKKPTTTQSYLNACKQFFKWCAQFNIYPNIMKYVKGAKIDVFSGAQKNAIRLNQVQATLAQFDVESNDIKTKRDYAIILLLASCGLRTIELERANIGDFADCCNQRLLYVQGKGKTDKTQAVEIPLQVEKAINDYLSMRTSRDANEPLFISVSNHDYGKRMTKNSISRICKTAMRNVGIEDKHAHGFRHFAITQAILNGADIMQVQQMARHQNINTTMIYNHAIERANNHCETSVCDTILNKGSKE